MEKEFNTSELEALAHELTILDTLDSMDNTQLAWLLLNATKGADGIDDAIIQTVASRLYPEYPEHATFHPWGWKLRSKYIIYFRNLTREKS